MVKDSFLSIVFFCIFISSCNSKMTPNNEDVESRYDSLIIINPFTEEGEYNTVDFYSTIDSSISFSLKERDEELVCDPLDGKIVMYYVYDKCYILFYKRINAYKGEVIVGNNTYFIKNNDHKIIGTNAFLENMLYSPQAGDTIYDSNYSYSRIVNENNCYYKINSRINDYLEIEINGKNYFIKWKKGSLVYKDRLCFPEYE